MEDPSYADKTINTDLFLKASKYQNMNISEEVKARFLVHLVKEFRKNREITKFDKHASYIKT